MFPVERPEYQSYQEKQGDGVDTEHEQMAGEPSSRRGPFPHLRLGAATAGAFLSSDGQRVNFSYDDQPAKGEVAVQLSRAAGAPGLTGNGALLSLTFMTLAPGNTGISVIDSAMQNSKLQSVPAQKPGVEVEIR